MVSNIYWPYMEHDGCLIRDRNKLCVVETRLLMFLVFCVVLCLRVVFLVVFCVLCAQCYHNATNVNRTVWKSTSRIVDTDTISIFLSNLYMISHFPDLIYPLQWKFYRTKPADTVMQVLICNLQCIHICRDTGSVLV